MAKKTSNRGQRTLYTQDTLPVMPDGFYSGDRPNARMSEFVSANSIPYDHDSDTYATGPFLKQITIGKRKSPIMDLHIYWSKKHHDAIRQYISHFTAAGGLVLDPFCGSGGTALAALLEDRKAIAIDLSPAATFITKNYCAPISDAEVMLAFTHVAHAVASDIAWLYKTKCDRCGGEASTAYTVYSQVFQCPRCLTKIALFDCEKAESKTQAGKPVEVNVCPHCHKSGHQEVIRSQHEKFGSVPVSVSYICENGCKPSRGERQHNDTNKKKREYFEQYDLAKIKEIDSKPIPYWYPMGFDMSGFSRYQRDALYYYNVKEVADLFTKRNLWALAAIRKACTETKHSEYLLFCLNTAILTVSRMCRHDYPSVMAGAYYMPQINRELNVWDNFEGRVPRKLAGTTEIASKLSSNPKLLISCQSATDMSLIPANTIDYVFTDPPYAETIQYGELNYVWEAWLGLNTRWHDHEIIVNETRKKSENEWTERMKKAMSECFRVLKPGRWLSLCYHDTSEGTWESVQRRFPQGGNDSHFDELAAGIFRVSVGEV